MGKNDGKYNTAAPDRYLLLRAFAHKNRKFPTEAESVLWGYLRARKLSAKFNRQHIIGDYIVDFVCLDKKLIIEVDGAYHSEFEQIEKDEYRAQRLNDMGFSVIRFTNEEVLAQIDKVINNIKNRIA